MSALPALFLLVKGAMKLIKLQVVVKATVELGYAETVILPLGLVLLSCTILYVIPRTAVLRAILLTGYLGGAVATHVRVENAWFGFRPRGSHGWAGLFLRNERLRRLCQKSRINS